MKTEEEQNHKVYQSPMLPRVFLKPNSQSGQRQRRPLNTRHTSIYSPTTSKNRRETVKKLIQQFENQSFLQDLKKTEKIHTFSEKITDMCNTEMFELCETSSKKQCPDCALYWEIGIVYSPCGRCLKPSQRTEQLDKKSYDALSIPGYVIKKNLAHGATHGASERQRKFCKAKDMLQKARQPKHGGYKTIF